MMKFTINLIAAILLISCNTNDKRPNVVFILADDLGCAQVGCYGSDYYQTPNVDRLSKEGMRFSDAYAAAPVCSPTRASIMTGKYPGRIHITDFIPGNTSEDSLLVCPDFQRYLSLNERTIGELARDAGYATALFGKWHLSIEKTPPGSLPYNPDKQGFDASYITYKPAGDMAQPWQTPENDAHNVDTLTRLALEFMSKNKDKPFFLMISHNTIHDPLMEGSELIRKYKNLDDSDKPENHPVIAAMMETLDNSVGDILQKLDELHLAENTIVVFYSDNGGKHSYAKQVPFRAGKGWLYEGGIRVPLVIRWPGKIKPGVVNATPVISNDFYPTFNSIFELNEPSEHLDGLSLMPLFNDSAILRETFYWHYPHYHRGSGMQPAGAIRHGNYKLIEWFEGKLRDESNFYELYDLSDDPGETLNLSDSLSDISNELLNKLHVWHANVNVQMPVLNKNWNISVVE